MAITINTFSNFGNQPVTIKIDGHTPAELTLTGLKIDYGQNEVGDYIIDWTGSISFFGRTSLFDEFGAIGHKSHKITIDYGSEKHFVGYILSQVYNVLNTGFEEYFTLNIESSLNTLNRELFLERTNLYSIQYLLNRMVEVAEIPSIEIKKSFSESLDSLKVYSANFVNDDSKNENYLTILEYICTTLGLKAFMSWTGVLMITSCELLNGTDPYKLEGHLGIDEDYSVGKTINAASVTVSNYAMPEIPANFELNGASKITDQRDMRIRRGKRYAIGKRGNYHVYFRQIYQYRPGQNAWKFKKYNSAWQPLSDTDIYDSTKYMSGAVPLAGAYPIAWGTAEGNRSGFKGFEQAIWFKAVNGNSYIWNENLQKMITLELDNYLVPPSTFFSTSFDAMYCVGVGNVNSWYRGWNTDYDADNDSSYSANMDECLVQISPAIPRNMAGPPPLTLAMSIKWTDLDGTVKYWDARASVPNWATTNKEYFEVRVNATSEFEFGASTENMPAPMNEDGTYAIFEGQKRTNIWCRFPGTMGKLEISFGLAERNQEEMAGVLFRNLNFETSQAITDISKINLAQMDVLYSNLDEFSQVNADYDKTATFHIYSDNDHSGRGQLFIDSADERVAEINFLSAKEKPEYHFIRLATKWESNAKVYNDIILFDDIKASYEDRFFNGGSFDLIEGIASAQLVSCNQNIGGLI